MKMKKLAAAIAAALVLATSAVCLTACGGGTPAGNDTSVSAQQDTFVLEGTWQITEATAEGIDLVAVAQQVGKMDQLTVTFQGGVATVNLMGDVTTGNYTYENGVLTLEGGVAEINGNRIEFNVEGVHLVLEKNTSSTEPIGDTTDSEVKYETATDHIQSLNGTTWRISSMTENGEEISGEMKGAMVTFTEEQMILSYGGETDYVSYTLDKGVINAEGVTGTVSDKQIKFQQGDEIMIMERTEVTEKVEPTGALNSLAGTNWTVTRMTDDGEDVSDQLGDIGGISVTFTVEQMIMTANGLGESEYVDYTFENGVIDAEGIQGSISGDTLTFQDGENYIVMKRS